MKNYHKLITNISTFNLTDQPFNCNCPGKGGNERVIPAGSLLSTSIDELIKKGVEGMSSEKEIKKDLIFQFKNVSLCTAKLIILFSFDSPTLKNILVQLILIKSNIIIV